MYGWSTGIVADSAVLDQRPRARFHSHPRARAARLAIAIAVWTFLLGNAAGLVWLWWHGGNVTKVHTTGEALTSAARLTGLLSAYLALIQVVLLVRLPFLERLAGFDRLTVWHRWNGHACLDLVLAHVVLSIWGYALMDRLSIPKEISQMIWGGIYPGMITATVGTFLLIAVVVSSIVVVRRRLRYEWWYAVHLAAYAAIALAWFHQIPTGNELVLDRIAADYWTSLYIATLALIVVFRIGVPFLNTFRFRLRVAEVVEEGPGVVSLRISGRRLDRLNAQPGQFFLWRFLAHDSWWASHPFSLSAAPNGGSLRITVKALGDFSGKIRRVRPGTRVVAEGPFGVIHRGGPPPGEGRAHRRRHRHHADPRPARGDERRRHRALSRHARRRHHLSRRARRARRANAASTSASSSVTTRPTKAAICCPRSISESSFRTSPSARSTSAGHLQ